MRGILASNTLSFCRNGDTSPPGGSPRPFTRHLFQEKRNLIGDIKPKPFAVPQKPVDEGHGARGHEGRHLHQCPMLAAGSGQLPVVSGGRLGPQRRMRLCSTNPDKDKRLLGSHTPRGGEVKGQQSRQQQRKRRPVWWADFQEQLPSPSWVPLSREGGGEHRPGGAQAQPLAWLLGRNFQDDKKASHVYFLSHPPEQVLSVREVFAPAKSRAA